MKTSVLVFSCDKYSDIWGPFFSLLFRYWDCPYEVYVTAESEQCLVPKVKTINTQGEFWTDRIRRAIEQIPTEYVIGMCEDFFMRRRVRQEVIYACEKFMDDNPNAACFNFEKEYDWVNPSGYTNFGKKPLNGMYKKSCQPTLWRKSALLKLLSESMNAWQWEMSDATNDYEYYIWTGSASDLVFEYGYHDNKWFGIQKGKWVASDVVPLFAREGIDIDFSIRGTV